jgi:Protein of unknown function (DUF3006)
MQSDSVAPGVTEQRWVIDSIEAQVASIEVDGATMIVVPQWLLPDDARVGHVLRARREPGWSGGRSVVSIEIDQAATDEALARSAAQVKKGVRETNDPGGNIVL